MGDVPDWDLIERARHGEMEAYAELVRRYERPVVHFCQRMVGSREDAEDLAQESFVRVYRYVDRLTPSAKFSTLLFGIARNLTLNFMEGTASFVLGTSDVGQYRLNLLDDTSGVVVDAAGNPLPVAGTGDRWTGMAHRCPDRKARNPWLLPRHYTIRRRITGRPGKTAGLAGTC